MFARLNSGLSIKRIFGYFSRSWSNCSFFIASDNRDVRYPFRYKRIQERIDDPNSVHLYEWFRGVQRNRGEPLTEACSKDDCFPNPVRPQSLKTLLTDFNTAIGEHIDIVLLGKPPQIIHNVAQGNRQLISQFSLRINPLASLLQIGQEIKLMSFQSDAAIDLLIISLSDSIGNCDKHHPGNHIAVFLMGRD